MQPAAPGAFRSALDICCAPVSSRTPKGVLLRLTLHNRAVQTCVFTVDLLVHRVFPPADTLTARLGCDISSGLLTNTDVPSSWSWLVRFVAKPLEQFVRVCVLTVLHVSLQSLEIQLCFQLKLGCCVKYNFEFSKLSQQSCDSCYICYQTSCWSFWREMMPHVGSAQLELFYCVVL